MLQNIFILLPVKLEVKFVFQPFHFWLLDCHSSSGFWEIKHLLRRSLTKPNKDCSSFQIPILCTSLLYLKQNKRIWWSAVSALVLQMFSLLSFWLLQTLPLFLFGFVLLVLCWPTELYFYVFKTDFALPASRVIYYTRVIYFQHLRKVIYLVILW